MHATKIIFSVSLLFLSIGCTAEQQNGNDIRLEQPFILSAQPWKITRQLTAANGERICTVSAGEIQITQRSRGHDIIRQVGTSNNIDPGDHYKILVGSHNYETLESWFDPIQSQAIIKDMLESDMIYTEKRELTLEFKGQTLRSVDNKIPMNDFGRQYRACEHFVSSGS